MKSKRYIFKAGILILSLLVIFTLAGCGSNNTDHDTKYSVAGTVLDGEGNPIAGVSLAIKGSKIKDSSVQADENGKWSAGDLEGEVTITPAKEDWTFNPSAVTVTEKDAGKKDINFTGQEIIYPDAKALTPGKDATGVETGANVSVEFNQDVTEADLTGITIIDSSANPVSDVTAGLSGRVLTISHADFDLNTTYTVTVPADAVVNNNGVGNKEISWSFTTREALSPIITNRFVAVGGDGNNAKAFWSDDNGAHWTGVSPGGNYLRKIAYGDGRFVAVGFTDGGNQALISWSADGGENWTNGTIDSTVIPHAIAYGNNRFVAVGSKKAWYSTDQGQNWTEAETFFAGDPTFYEITFANDHFVAVGPSCVIWRSTDGNIWTDTSPRDPVDLYDIAYGNNRFITVGLNGKAYWFEGTDDWNDCSPEGDTLNAIAFGNNQFIAVGESGTAWRTTDGGLWTDCSPGGTVALCDITYGNGLFIAVGQDGRVCWTTDGTSWTDLLPPVEGVTYFEGIAFCP